MKDTLLVPARYCGPPRSANGGYVSGSLAHELGDTSGRGVVVSLRQPPPLDAALHVAEKADGLDLTFGGALLAHAEWTDSELEPVEAVTWAEATAASAAYPGFREHPFPRCYVCGTERPDGLQIYPGPVPATGERARMAAPWTPRTEQQADWHEYDDAARRACLAATWAALDCIGGWAGGLDEGLMVLGRMTAIVDELPVVGEPHVVTGEHRGSEGRKTWTAATLHDADGRIVARAEHTWVAVDPELFV